MSLRLVQVAIESKSHTVVTSGQTMMRFINTYNSSVTSITSPVGSLQNNLTIPSQTASIYQAYPAGMISFSLGNAGVGGDVHYSGSVFGTPDTVLTMLVAPDLGYDVTTPFTTTSAVCVALPDVFPTVVSSTVITYFI